MWVGVRCGEGERRGMCVVGVGFSGRLGRELGWHVRWSQLPGGSR